MKKIIKILFVLAALNAFDSKAKMRGLELVCSKKNTYLTTTQISRLKKLILEDPGELLTKNDKARVMEPSRRESWSKFEQRREKENPLYLLSEVSYIGSMDRKNHPQPRDTYTKNIAKAIKNSFADLGAGDFFQTLVILTNFLEKNKRAKLDIYLIDVDYVGYIDLFKKLETQTVDTSKTNYDFGKTGKDPATVGTFFGSISLLLDKDEKNIIIKGEKIEYDVYESEKFDPKYLPYVAKTFHKQLNQFISFLKKAYPYAKLKFFLYPNVDDLIEDYKNGEIYSFPDTVAASLFGNEKDFNKLVNFAAENNKIGVKSFRLGTQDQKKDRWDPPKSFDETVITGEVQVTETWFIENWEKKGSRSRR